MILARAARPRGEVVLEIRVAARDVLDALQRSARERRAAEVRVHDHAGRVEDAAKPWTSCRAELVAQPLAEVAGIGSRLDLLARAGDHRPRRSRPPAGRPRRGRARPRRAGLAISCRKDRRLHSKADGRVTERGRLAAAFRFRASPSSLRRPCSSAPRLAGAFELRDRAYRDEPLPGVRVLSPNLAARLVDLLRLARPTSSPGAAGGAPARSIAGATTAPPLAAGRGPCHRASSACSRRSRCSATSGPRSRCGRAPCAGSPRSSRRTAVRPCRRTISLNGVTPVVVPAHAGSTVDRWRLLTDLKRRAIDGGHGPIVVHFVTTQPRLSTATAREAAVAARTMLSHAITLTYDGTTRGSLQPNKLAQLLRFRVSGNRYVAAFDAVATARAAHAAVKQFSKPARDATFAVDGNRVSRSALAQRLRRRSEARPSPPSPPRRLGRSAQRGDHDGPRTTGAHHAEGALARDHDEAHVFHDRRWARRRRTGSTTST